METQVTNLQDVIIRVLESDNTISRTTDLKTHVPRHSQRNGDWPQQSGVTFFSTSFEEENIYRLHNKHTRNTKTKTKRTLHHLQRSIRVKEDPEKPPEEVLDVDSNSVRFFRETHIHQTILRYNRQSGCSLTNSVQ